jgi:hypothetical protein
MGVMDRHHVVSIVPTNKTISLLATWTPSLTHTTEATSTPTGDAAANSLWAKVLQSGDAGKLAGGIDAVLGIVLIVFLSVVIYQWRARSGRRDSKKEEKERPLPSVKEESTGSSSAPSVAENVEVVSDKREKKEEEGVVIAGK